MKSDKWAYISWAIGCISISAVAIAGLYITKSKWCLLALLFIPSLSRKSKEVQDE